MRVHTYVIASDAGSAPNYDLPAVTLAVCKPRIRKKAKFGELVLAFAGSRLKRTSPHSVVWAGIVSEVMTFTQYWNDSRFATKKPDRTDVPDNFYKPTDNGGFIWQLNQVHGPEAQDKDTGGRNVLVFNTAWRFGAFGPVLPQDFGLRMIGGRRGERVTDLKDSEWQQLKAWLDAQPKATIEAGSDRKSRRSCTPRARPMAPQTASPTRRRC